MLRRCLFGQLGGVRRLASARNSKERSGGNKQDAAPPATLPKYICRVGRAIELDVQSVTNDMNAAVEHLQAEASRLRIGRASTSMLDHVKAKTADGALLSVTKLGVLAVKDAQTLTINLFDQSNGKAAIAALQSAGLDLLVHLEGNKLLVTLPRVTRELREKMARSFGEQAEISKRIVRDIRTTAINSSTSAIKDLDLRRQYDTATQKLHTAMLKRIDDLVAAKQKSILE